MSLFCADDYPTLNVDWNGATPPVWASIQCAKRKRAQTEKAAALALAAKWPKCVLSNRALGALMGVSEGTVRRMRKPGGILDKDRRMHVPELGSDKRAVGLDGRVRRVLKDYS